jgi:integrase
VIQILGADYRIRTDDLPLTSGYEKLDNGKLPGHGTQNGDNLGTQSVMATFTKRPSGKWQAKVRNKGFPPISKSFTYKDDAEKWARENEVAIQRGMFFDRSPAEKTTLKEIFDLYREHILPLKKGKHYKPALKVLEENFGQYCLAALTSKMVSKYKTDRMKVVGNGTVRKELKLFALIIDLADREWGIEVAKNPVRKVSLPPEPRGRNRRLEGDEYKRLYQACKNKNNEALVLFILAVETGARIGEILALQWKEINFNLSIAEINDAKTGDRVIPFSPVALKAIKSLGVKTEGRIITRWFASDSFNHTWEKICEEAKVTNLHFHDLRHEGVSRLFETGFNIMEVASVSGHKSLSMLKRYTHMRSADIAKKMADNAIANAQAKKPPAAKKVAVSQQVS